MRYWIVAATLSAAVGLSGCASTPDRFFRLGVVPATDTPPMATSLHVDVAAVTIPAINSRPQLVLLEGEGPSVRILEHSRWAEPLPAGIGRVVAADLGSRLGTPYSTYGTDSTTDHPQWRVTIDLQALDAGNGTVHLDALWSVRQVDGTTKSPTTLHSAIVEPVQGDAAEATVLAESRALARLSTEIAAEISLELRGNAPAAMPSGR